ncbi:FAD-dependent oxidoreductase, partial [Staphylococcus aureus]
MSEMPIDEASIAVKELAITERTPLLIVGAGPAGIAAAMAASRRGIAAMLVDENPVPFETMGEEVPLHFGQRMTGATR